MQKRALRTVREATLGDRMATSGELYGFLSHGCALHLYSVAQRISPTLLRHPSSLEKYPLIALPARP